MNMEILDGRNKPMHVGLFQTKEERKAFLDQQHQMNTMRPQMTYPIYLQQQPVIQGAGQYMPQQQPQRQMPYGMAPMMSSPQLRPYQGGPPANTRGRGGGPRPGGMMSRPGGPNTFAGGRPGGRPAAVDVPSPVAPVPSNNQSWTNTLLNVSPEEQKHMLGEKLFPLVFKLRPEDAAKITGMILELDVSELLSYLESGDSLKRKVQEAVRVLEEYNANPPQ